MLGAEFVVDFLHAVGAKFYTFPGGTIAPLYDALRQRDIDVVVARHEQGAGYAALAQGRLLQQPQVVMVTSGPGVTNLVTVVADAFFDATPLIVLTGQIGTADLLNGRPVRQRGFQEVDTPRLMASICKHCYQVTEVDDLPVVLAEAYSLALSGRRGPVVIDLPMNIQRECMRQEPDHMPPITSPIKTADAGSLEAVIGVLGVAKCPIILAGQGVLQAGAVAALRTLAHEQRIPVVSSLLGLGVLPGDDGLCMGFVGHTGMQAAGKVLQEADCVLVLGARLDVRQTGSCVDAFCPKAQIIHVDNDRDELNNPRVRTDIKVLTDVKVFLDLMYTYLSKPTGPIKAEREKWLEHTAALKTTEAIDMHEELSPKTVVRFLDDASRQDDIVVTTGVGSHQHWAARHFTYDWPKRVLLTSGGHGTMGYDVPSAVGAALTYPERTIYCIVGDASFQMNIQELQVIQERNLNVKIIVLNNGRMALVSQFQKITWGSDPTTGDIVNPDFAAIAQAYAIKSVTVSTVEELCSLAPVLSDRGPLLVHCRITPNADVLPMLLGGEKLDAMHGGRML